jgi:hypothetical protein
MPDYVRRSISSVFVPTRDRRDGTFHLSRLYALYYSPQPPGVLRGLRNAFFNDFPPQQRLFIGPFPEV